MRCYCCDNQNTSYDYKTSRFYCSDCMDVITETIQEMEEQDEWTMDEELDERWDQDDEVLYPD